MIEFVQWYDNPSSCVGRLMLSSDGEAITGCWFEEESTRFWGYTLEKNLKEASLAVFDQASEWLDTYFMGKDPGPLPPTRVKASEFRQLVCSIMAEIPYGQCITYGDIAQEISARRGGKKMSAQAVGGAVGHNPVGIIIPCHRVIGAKGNLTGYGGGMDRKIALLKLEGFDMSKFTVPTKGTAL